MLPKLYSTAILNLQANWKEYSDPNDNVYYFNSVTGESTWDHPLDKHYRELYMKMKGISDRRAARGAGEVSKPRFPAGLGSGSGTSAPSSPVLESPRRRRRKNRKQWV